MIETKCLKSAFLTLYLFTAVLVVAGDRSVGGCRDCGGGWFRFKDRL